MSDIALDDYHTVIATRQLRRSRAVRYRRLEATTFARHWQQPDGPQSVMNLTLNSASNNVDLTVQLTVAYLAPDTQLLDALIWAAQCSVDDQPLLLNCSGFWSRFDPVRSKYTHFLKNGVKIYGRWASDMNAETACIDGICSFVGSRNPHSRRFYAERRSKGGVPGPRVHCENENHVFR